MLSLASAHVSDQPFVGETSIRSRDNQSLEDTVRKSADLAKIAGSPHRAAQGMPLRTNSGGTDVPKSGTSDGNSSNHRKPLWGQRKWEAKTGNLPYWEVKAITALKV